MSINWLGIGSLHAFILGVGLLVGCNQSSPSDPTQSRWDKQLGNLHSGMESEDILTIIAEAIGHRPLSEDWVNRDSIIYVLDADWEVRIQYDRNKRLDTFKVTPRGDLSEYRETIPPDIYSDVCLVHASPEPYNRAPISDSYDPVALIRAVNRLQERGTEPALSVLRKYIDLVNRERSKDLPNKQLSVDRVLLILRLLFVPTGTPGEMPALGMLPPDLVAVNRSSWPLLPLAVVDGMPFFLVRSSLPGYGDWQLPEELLQYCRSKCTLREKPLEPSGSPLAAVEKLTHSEEWRVLFHNSYNKKRLGGSLGFVRWQALRALGSKYVMRTSGEERSALEDRLQLDSYWSDKVSEVDKLKPYWDRAKQSFVVSPR